MAHQANSVLVDDLSCYSCVLYKSVAAAMFVSLHSQSVDRCDTSSLGHAIDVSLLNLIKFKAIKHDEDSEGPES